MASDPTYINIEALNFDDLKLSLSAAEFTELQLCYRGEGNENLVLQAPKIKHVLRFRKNETEVDRNCENDKLRISFWYYYIFVKSFFSTYSMVPVIADVPESEVLELDRRLLSQRPESRKGKRVFYNGVEIHPDYAFIPVYAKYAKLRDHIQLLKAPQSELLPLLISADYLEYREFVYTVLTKATSLDKFAVFNSETDTMCIEIKPKQAWTAVTDRRPVCAYCMNQYFKFRMNKSSSISNYCPLDLFSGDPVRMKRALNALMKSPQNNLKIFKNGELIFGERNPEDVPNVLVGWFNESAEGCIDNFCHLMIKILTGEFASNEEATQLCCEPYTKSKDRQLCPHLNLELVEKSLASCSPCLRTGSLSGNSVLGRILNLQRIDEAGIETVYDFFETHKSDYSSELGYIGRLIAGTRLIGGKVEIPKLTVAEAYLLSAAAKDLSILIALKRVSSRDAAGYLVSDLYDQMYEVNISVVDVGPKPVSCIKKHWKRDADVITAWAEHFCPESILSSVR